MIAEARCKILRAGAGIEAEKRSKIAIQSKMCVEAEEGRQDVCLARGCGFLFFKQKTAYEIRLSLVGSEIV